MSAVLSSRTPSHGEFTPGRLSDEPKRVITTGFRRASRRSNGYLPSDRSPTPRPDHQVGDIPPAVGHLDDVFPGNLEGSTPDEVTPLRFVEPAGRKVVLRHPQQHRIEPVGQQPLSHGQDEATPQALAMILLDLADLQRYTVELYPELERVCGQDCGIHMTGGLQLADPPEWMDWLKMVHARGRYLGMETELISAREAAELFPLMDPSLFVGAMWDRHEGHVDPAGVTRAYAKAAEVGGATVVRHTMVEVLSQRPDGTWDVRTSRGDVHAEHVVNAGGLWGREVGRTVGLELPLLAMAHQYIVTGPVPEVAEYRRTTGKELPTVVDFGGDIYMREESGGILLGT